MTKYTLNEENFSPTKGFPVKVFICVHTFFHFMYILMYHSDEKKGTKKNYIGFSHTELIALNIGETQVYSLRLLLSVKKLKFAIQGKILHN